MRLWILGYLFIARIDNITFVFYQARFWAQFAIRIYLIILTVNWCVCVCVL